MSEMEPGGEASPEEWQARREALAQKLEQQKVRAGVIKPNPAGGMRGAADGMKLASEFVAGILAGAGIGYLIDRIAGEVTRGQIWSAEVGSATHYHATYVAPRWARAMQKVDTIGRHIFYRTFGGGWG